MIVPALVPADASQKAAFPSCNHLVVSWRMRARDGRRSDRVRLAVRTALLRKRTSEKWPSGGSARRSISSIAGHRASPVGIARPRRTRCASRACVPPASEPSRSCARKPGFGADAGEDDDLAAGLAARARTRRAPLPGLGTAVMTYCATTTSKRCRREIDSFSASITSIASTWSRPSSVTRRAPSPASARKYRRRQTRLARRIVRQRDAGADADFEDAPADPLGGIDRRAAAAPEHRPNTSRRRAPSDHRPSRPPLSRCPSVSP